MDSSPQPRLNEANNRTATKEGAWLALKKKRFCRVSLNSPLALLPLLELRWEKGAETTGWYRCDGKGKRAFRRRRRPDKNPCRSR